MKIMFNVLIIVLAVLFTNCEKENSDPDPGNSDTLPEDTIPEPIDGPLAVDKTNDMNIYVHYMPWFETPETNNNGSWGIHWTMANRNPENGEIASHYYPLIGPYASSDKDVIEYHLLLMKYAGIDGLIIDWYGSTDINDFGMNRRNTEAVIDMLDDVGLQFALTYEDWTTEAVVGNGGANSKVEAATNDFIYMESNYFNLDSYIKIDNKALLTTFGPQQLQTEEEWTEVLNNITTPLTYLSLWYESGDLGAHAAGEFGWVYEDNTHAQNFINNRMSQFDVAMGSAYPGFIDFYNEGGWGTSIDWEIDHANGATFETTLGYAKSKNIDYLQLVTWNDFGEGTMIEPTNEFEYLFLEKIQEFTGVTYDKTELEYITKLYNLRKSKAGDNDAQQELNKAFNYFVSLQVEEAISILDSF